MILKILVHTTPKTKEEALAVNNTENTKCRK